jgi:hypothetical protein
MSVFFLATGKLVPTDGLVGQDGDASWLPNSQEFGPFTGISGVLPPASPEDAPLLSGGRFVALPIAEMLTIGRALLLFSVPPSIWGELI